MHGGSSRRRNPTRAPPCTAILARTNGKRQISADDHVNPSAPEYTLRWYANKIRIISLSPNCGQRAFTKWSCVREDV